MTPVFYVLLSFFSNMGGMMHTEFPCPNWECVQRVVQAEVSFGLYRVQVFTKKSARWDEIETIPPLADYWLP